MTNMKTTGARGFTLAEVILTVAVLAIITTLTTPALVHFMRQRDVREEISNQIAIRDAIAAMLKATGDLPDDTATGTNAWYNKLAQYTNLSPYQMQNDQWGNPRAYIMLRNTQTLLNNSVMIFYVTLHSRGPDLKAATITDSGGTTLVPVNGNDFAAASNSSWWKFNSTSPVAAFGAVGVPAGSDDIMLRYTDYPEKIAAYNLTLQRMDKVTQALESYSRAKYAERVVTCNGSSPPADCTSAPPEKQIHYPASDTDAANSALYNSVVIAETQAQNANIGGSWLFYSSVADNASRRANLVNLMRLLGLPDEYCCSALEHYTDASGAVQDKPFYYFSNPRPRASNSTCGTRPTLNTTKLPARLTNTLVPDGTSGATCG